MNSSKNLNSDFVEKGIKYTHNMSPKQPFYCLSLLITLGLMYLRLEPLLGPYLGPCLGPDVSFW